MASCRVCSKATSESQFGFACHKSCCKCSSCSKTEKLNYFFFEQKVYCTDCKILDGIPDDNNNHVVCSGVNLLPQLLQSGEFSDITIKLGDSATKVVHAHKIILAQYSAYFSKVLKNDFKDSNEMEWKHESGEVLFDIIPYFYSNSIHVSPQKFAALYACAWFLQSPTLIDLLQRYFSKALTVYSACDFLTNVLLFPETSRHPPDSLFNFVGSCLQVIAENLSYFNNNHPDYLCELSFDHFSLITSKSTNKDAITAGTIKYLNKNIDQQSKQQTCHLLNQVKQISSSEDAILLLSWADTFGATPCVQVCIDRIAQDMSSLGRAELRELATLPPAYFVKILDKKTNKNGLTAQIAKYLSELPLFADGLKQTVPQILRGISFENLTEEQLHTFASNEVVIEHGSELLIQGLMKHIKVNQKKKQSNHHSTYSKKFNPSES